MSPMMSMPFQKALKLPATSPERIVSEAPPSREAVTISWTCFECELVKTFVNSGISTAASVPQLMIEASCHQESQFGWHDFQGSNAVDGSHTVAAGDSIRLRYRFIFHRGDESAARVTDDAFRSGTTTQGVATARAPIRSTATRV